MRLLLTGFEPFGGRDVNASGQVALALANDSFPGVDLRVAILPVDRLGGPSALLAAVRGHRPDAVLCLGEASGRSALAVERVAVNLMDYRL